METWTSVCDESTSDLKKQDLKVNAISLFFIIIFNALERVTLENNWFTDSEKQTNKNTLTY